MTINLFDPVRNPIPQQQVVKANPMQSILGGFQTGMSALDLLNKQSMSKEALAQERLKTQGLTTQSNIQNTINRLQEVERQIGFGATPQQLEQTLKGFIAESQARGGNPADSIQALQTLQQGGVQGLQGLLGQAKQVFQQQGLIKSPELSEEAKLDILGQQKLELEKLKGEQDLTLAKLKSEFDSQPDKLKQADSLRGEVVNVNKRLQFDDTKSAFGRIQASNDGSAAGDLSLIFNYMKMLDPGSTVREGEFATAQNAQGVSGRVISLYNQLINGERMTPSQRAEFTNQAEKIFNQSTANFKQAIRPILNIGKARGLTEDEILGEGFFDSLGLIDANDGKANTGATESESQVVEPIIQTFIDASGNPKQFKLSADGSQWEPM